MAEIIVGMVCVAEAAREYPKRIPMWPLSLKAVHTEPDQVCIGLACSCKKMHDRSKTDDEYGRMWDKRRNGRKPRYKDLHCRSNKDNPSVSNKIGKAGELRAKHKRPFHPL